MHIYIYIPVLLSRPGPQSLGMSSWNWNFMQILGRSPKKNGPTDRMRAYLQLQGRISRAGGGWAAADPLYWAYCILNIEMCNYRGRIAGNFRPVIQPQI